MVGAGLTDMASMYGTNDIPNVLIPYFGGIPTKETLPLMSRQRLKMMQRQLFEPLERVDFL